MTRRNDKRNNRRYRQRNNNSELNPFAQMLMVAHLGKGAEMIAETLKKKKAEEKKEDKPHTGIRQSDNLLESSCIINGDGSATEIPIPDGFQIFISEDGKPMIRKKIEGDEVNKTSDAAEGLPVTYDDICKKFFLDKKIFFTIGKEIVSGKGHDENYDDLDNCTSETQTKRMAAYNKLMNIAKYLNGGWNSKFDNKTENWQICCDNGAYLPKFTCIFDDASVSFPSKDVTKEAIRIMGEESLNDLFNKDW